MNSEICRRLNDVCHGCKMYTLVKFKLAQRDHRQLQFYLILSITKYFVRHKQSPWLHTIRAISRKIWKHSQKESYFDKTETFRERKYPPLSLSLSFSLSLSTDESKENYQILLSFKKKKEKEQNTENKNKKLQKPNFPQHRKCIEHRENLGENRNVSRRWKFRVKNASRQTRRMLIRVSKRDERGRRIAFPIERRLAAAMRAIIQ